MMPRSRSTAAIIDSSLSLNGTVLPASAGASPIAFDLGPIEVGKARRTGEIARLPAKPLQLGETALHLLSVSHKENEWFPRGQLQVICHVSALTFATDHYCKIN